jgi:hypothetical protein
MFRLLHLYHTDMYFTSLLSVTMRDIFYNQPVRRRLFHSRSVLFVAANMKFRTTTVLSYWNTMFTFAGILSVCSCRKLLKFVKERIVRLALAQSDVSFILTVPLRYVGSLLWFVHA